MKFLVFHGELPILEVSGDNMKIKLLGLEGLTYKEVLKEAKTK